MNHESQCKICAFGAEDIDWSLSNTAIGEIVDCAESSVRRHRKWAKANGFDLGSTNLVTNGHEFPETPVPGSWIPRRHWQTPNGEVLNSFQFVPDAVNEEGLNLDYDKLESAFNAVPDIQPQAEGGPQEVLVLADPQIGKAGEHGGGTKETIERVFASVERAIERYKINRPSHLYLVDLGDPIENVGSTASQIGTNDLSVPDQVLTYIRLTVEIISRLAPHVDAMTHVTVTSNHGEARSSLKVNPYGSENDWGLHMQQVVKDRLGDKLGFIRPEINEDTSVVTMADGTKVAFNHGHHSGTQAGIKKWVTGQIVGRRPGWDADAWLLGHFHNPHHMHVGNGIDVFGTPSIDPGSAWFTRKTGESSPPGMTALTFSHGNWSNYSIL